VETQLDALLKADSEALASFSEIILPNSRPYTRSNSLAPTNFESMGQGKEEAFSGSGSEDNCAGEVEQMVQEADTPVPTPQADEESESKESEEVYGEEDAEGEKLKAQREQEIQELEETIGQKKISVSGIVNPIVRGRVLDGSGRLEAELALKRQQLEDEEMG
jgi:TATA-binding protein-associated factor Taf7